METGFVKKLGSKLLEPFYGARRLFRRSKRTKLTQDQLKKFAKDHGLVLATSNDSGAAQKKRDCSETNKISFQQMISHLEPVADRNAISEVSRALMRLPDVKTMAEAATLYGTGCGVWKPNLECTVFFLPLASPTATNGGTPPMIDVGKVEECIRAALPVSYYLANVELGGFHPNCVNKAQIPKTADGHATGIGALRVTISSVSVGTPGKPFYCPQLEEVSPGDYNTYFLSAPSNYVDRNLYDPKYTLHQPKVFPGTFKRSISDNTDTVLLLKAAHDVLCIVSVQRLVTVSPEECSMEVSDKGHARLTIPLYQKTQGLLDCDINLMTVKHVMDEAIGTDRGLSIRIGAMIMDEKDEKSTDRPLRSMMAAMHILFRVPITQQNLLS